VSHTRAIADLIQDAEQGGATAGGPAADELFATLYRELHAIAESQLRRSDSSLTLGATTLLHEAYLSLSGASSATAQFPDRPRFLAYASKAMRGLIIDYARSRRALKRGGEFEITRIGERDVPMPTFDTDVQLERLGEALDRLGEIDGQLAQLVDLHFFCGFSLLEIAALRGVSKSTIHRDWREARVLLKQLARAE
jgi:RNA polymerase sigma factor (TIGR02999 family)